MKQETLDYIAASIGIVAIISTYIFWLASRQIKDSLTRKIDKFVYDLTQKQESDTITAGYKMRRWQDINKLRFITLECRVEAIEDKLDMGACNIIQSIEDQLEEDTDSRF
jgi:cell division protein YceG involved in septum cleavage